MKQSPHALVSELLASMQAGVGGDNGAVTGQQDIELIDQLGHGDVAEDSHTYDGPDQTLHGHAATAQGRNALFTEQGSDELGRDEVGE